MAAPRRQREPATEARPPMSKVEPQKEHAWLQRMVGDWTFEAEVTMGPDQTPESLTGTESVRSLGGLWILAEGQGAMPGGGASSSVMTLGYDPRKRRFVGTFIASVMPDLWVYEGELDADGKLLTLHTEGPDMDAEAKTATYRETIELRSDDHRIFTSRMQADDGTWREIMSARYRRVT